MERSISVACIILGGALLWASSVVSERTIGATELGSIDDGTLVRVKGTVSNVHPVSSGAEVVSLDTGDGTVMVFLDRRAVSTLAPVPGESMTVVGRVEEFRGRKEVHVDAPPHLG